MSSFADVRAATCRIVTRDGRHQGTGFFLLPDGHLLTCHHVIFGLDELYVRLPASEAIYAAEYLADRSNLVADIAVLRVPDLKVTAVQLGRTREQFNASGYGYRPSAGEAEPKGHSFSGRVTLGQELALRPPDALINRLEAIDPESRAPWNCLPDTFRIGEVRNFEAHAALERGISGGPVYDRELHRVVGLFRAIEGDELAYVIPMDDAFETWPGLEALNQAEVHDTPLRELVLKHRLALVAEGTRPIVPLAWDTFRPLFRAYERFGGRACELAELDTFLTEHDKGYLFVTGTAGFGKTALLCYWVNQLRASGVTPVIHFITPRLGDGISEDSCLRNLCEQLLSVHDLTGDVPGDLRRLRVLYADLLRLSPPRDRVVVILDGLDEALAEWTPDEALFPQDLGQSVYVVFSARQIADRDWLASFNFPANTTPVIDLGQLERADVEDLLVKMGLSYAEKEDFDALVERILEITGGDPFYVRDVIRDLEGREASVASLKPYPVGHINYLREWWKDARRKNPGKAFVDLMGTLAALSAPLGRTELIRLSEDDELSGTNIDTLLEDASRYIEGNSENGYLMRHERIRSFVKETLDKDFDLYRLRLAEFCKNWQRQDLTDRALTYVLRYAVDHLIDVRRIEEAADLLTPEWITEKWYRFGSYLGLIRDLTQLCEAMAQPENAPDLLARTLPVAIARATVREIMASFPEELFRAWVALGGIDHVTDVLRSLSDYRGRSSEPLIVVAHELVDEDRLVREDVSRQDAFEQAARLLQRAISLIPLVRASMHKLERISELANLLSTRPFEAEERDSLLAYAISVTRDLEEPALRASALGVLAGTLAKFEDKRDEAHRLLLEAEEALERINFAPDVLFARGELLPALRHLFPDRLAEVVRSSLEMLESVPEAASLGKATLERFLRRWDPEQDADAPWVVPILEKLAALYLTDPLPENVLPAEILVPLIKLGHRDKALQLLERLWELSPLYGAYAFLDVADTLFLIDQELAAEYLNRAKDQKDEAIYGISGNVSVIRGLLAYTYATYGQWNEAFDLLFSIKSSLKNHLIPCIQLGSANAPDPQAMQRVARLVAMGESLGEDERVDVEAAAARALSVSAPDAARRYLEQAVRRCLGKLPEGEADNLRKLQALALLQHGKLAEADSAADACYWQHRRLAAYVALLKATPHEDAVVKERFYGRILTVVEHPEEDSAFLSDILKSGCEAACFLAAEDRERAEHLCDIVHNQLFQPRFWSEIIKCWASEVRARWEIDQDIAKRHLEQLVAWIGDFAPVSEHRWLYGELVMLASIMPDAVAACLQRVEIDVGLRATSKDDYEIWSSYINAVAKVDQTRALALCDRLVASLETFEPQDKTASYLQRMIQEFTGQFAGLDPRPDVVGTVTAAVLATAHSYPDRAQAMLLDVFDYGLTSATEAAREQAAIRLLTSLAVVEHELDQMFNRLYPSLEQRLREALPAEKHDEVLLAAIRAAGRAKYLDRARQVAQGIESPGVQEQAVGEIQTSEEYAQVRIETPLQSSYVHTRLSDLAYAVLHCIQIEGTTREALQHMALTITDDTTPLTRSRLLDEFAPIFILPLLELAGIEALTDLVHAIDDFDQCLINAAALIAQRA